MPSHRPFNTNVITTVTLQMYEKQTPFTLGQYGHIASFLNSFLYKTISLGLLTDPKSPLFASLHTLLMVLYARDNRARSVAGRVRVQRWFVKPHAIGRTGAGTWFLGVGLPMGFFCIVRAMCSALVFVCV